MHPDDKLLMFRNRLSKVYRHIHKQAQRQGISCYRVYDLDLPEFPFCIEVYEGRAYLAEYKTSFRMEETEHESWLEKCFGVISEVMELPITSIYSRMRKRKAGRQAQYQRLAETSEFFIVQEAGLNFKVNLSDYLDTGLFLDHRLTRTMVKELAKDKHVLNLFCYTGSFSVYAAAGGAASVTSVDLSNTYLDWARDNFRENELQDDRLYHFVKADVLQWIQSAPRDYYDLVILDPPTFSNSKMMKDFLDIQADHVQLLNDVLRSVKKGGVIFFSTNYRKFLLDKEAIKASEIKDITTATTPFDFKGKLFRWCYRIVR